MENGSLHDILSNNTVVVDGEFIRTVLACTAPLIQITYLPGDLLLPILGDITQGMRFLHAATPKVIHGDLKGANILVDERFRAKVVRLLLASRGRQSTNQSQS